MELSALPITYVLSVRRMLFLQIILKRHDDEITKKVYLCQKSNLLPCDLCQLIAKDIDKMDIHISDDHIAQMHESEYKKLIKRKVYDTAFIELEQLKESHSRVRDNQYKDLNQSYTTLS